MDIFSHLYLVQWKVNLVRSVRRANVSFSDLLQIMLVVQIEQSVGSVHGQ